MEGGKKLAEGGYGCVFHPEINCKGKQTTNTKYVSKIQKKDFSSDNEIDIGETLTEKYKDDPMKPLENNFAPVISSCPINIRKIAAPDINHCNVINKAIGTVNNFIMMKIRYIDMQDLDSFVMNNADANLLLLMLLSTYNHLLKSINLLIKANIVHFDLKGPNVVFNTKDTKPIIIDFGLSIPMYKKINYTNYFYIYAPEYYIWPPEAHYINLLLHHNDEPSEKEIHELSKRYVNNNAALNSFSVEFKNDFIKLVDKTLNKYNQIPLKDRIHNILKYCWKTWDNYSLSIIYLKFINFITHTQSKMLISNNFIKYMVKLHLKNIHPNYKKRLSVEQSLQQFNAFLYNEREDNIESLKEISIEIEKNKSIINKKINRDIKKTHTLTKKVTDSLR